MQILCLEAVRARTVYGQSLSHSSMRPHAGVRTSLVVCFILHTACRLAMAVTTSRHVMLAVLLGPETMAGALGVPVLTIGIKRFTTQARCWSGILLLFGAGLGRSSP